MSFEIDHLHLKSSDPEAMHDFLDKMFGAEHLGTAERGDTVRITLKLGGLLILLDGGAVADETARSTAAPGYDHLALLVSNHEDVMAELRRKGAKVTMEPFSPRPGIRAAFIEGPDRIAVEILDRNFK